MILSTYKTKGKKAMPINKRQLRLTLTAILESYQIDSLALEAKLVEATAEFIDRTEKRQDPVEVRKDIVRTMLGDAGTYAKFEATVERVAALIRVTPDGTDTWNAVIKFIMAK